MRCSVGSGQWLRNGRCSFFSLNKINTTHCPSTRTLPYLFLKTFFYPRHLFLCACFLVPFQFIRRPRPSMTAPFLLSFLFSLSLPWTPQIKTFTGNVNKHIVHPCNTPLACVQSSTSSFFFFFLFCFAPSFLCSRSLTAIIPLGTDRQAHRDPSPSIDRLFSYSYLHSLLFYPFFCDPSFALSFSSIALSPSFLFLFALSFLFLSSLSFLPRPYPSLALFYLPKTQFQILPFLPCTLQCTQTNKTVQVRLFFFLSVVTHHSRA